MPNAVIKNKGSEWRKVDLHVHTPFTKLNNQYPIEAGVWDKFCEEIEKSDVECIGITDYYSIDNYFTFIEKFKNKFPISKKVFFPNIEFRLEVSVNNKLEHVNIHVLFDHHIQEQKIKSFLSKLPTNKTRGEAQVFCSELQEGEYVSASVHYKEIKKTLKDVFGNSEHYVIICAANNDGLRADTKSPRKMCTSDEIDKISNIFFGGSQNTEYFLNGNRYEDGEKAEKKPVVTGSDAHSFEDLQLYLGKRFSRINEGKEVIYKDITWIKADLTFEGLKQIIYEPSERVFIGLEPDVEIRARNHPTKYIKSILITNVEGYDNRHGIWFKGELLEPSKELTAIIGNKGSGKSANTDVIGVLGNSHNQIYRTVDGKAEELFSFLNKKKFLKNNIASHYQATITWLDGNTTSGLLNQSVDETLPERVEYLPQKYLEQLCANIDDNEFRNKLNSVIFGYVSEKDKLGTTSFHELITYITEQANKDILQLKTLLHEKNAEIVTIEQKLDPEYNKQIDEKIILKNEELAAHKKNIPIEVKEPKENDDLTKKADVNIENIKKKIQDCNDSIILLSTEQTNLAKDLEDLKQAKQEFERQKNGINALETKYNDLFQKIHVKFIDVIALTIKYEKIDDVVKQKTERLTEIHELLIDESSISLSGLSDEQKTTLMGKSITYQLGQSTVQLKDLITALDKPGQDFQQYTKKKEEWEQRNSILLGDSKNPLRDTLHWLTNEKSKISEFYPIEYVKLKEAREQIVINLFSKKKSLVTFYNTVKTEIDSEIGKHKGELGDYNMSIEAGLRCEESFYNNFFTFINQQVRGSFCGIELGREILRNICEDNVDWNNEENITKVLKEINNYLHTDKRKDVAQTDQSMHIFSQMKAQKDPTDFYDYVYGLDFLQPQYDLKVDGKDLSELSPGERGGLLLIFYLMLDRRDIPLIIDQPEDNLDNKSIYEILVTFLKKAKKRRQIIMVTHNPNLAVVADAEQIVFVSINKKNKNDFDFSSGPIENSIINSIVVDILEGTMPAFNNRKLKYHKLTN